MRLVPTSVFIVTTFLVATVLLGGLGAPLWWMQAGVAAGWCLVVWMVIDVLRDRNAHVRQLEHGEEWGYQDRPDLRPAHAGRPRRPRDEPRT